MSAVGFIPARGGSKGIPRKNLCEVGGKSLLAWTIKAALDCGQFDGVYVSTEDAEIKAEAERCGATVVDRPAELAGDNVLHDMALAHALRCGVVPKTEIVCYLECTTWPPSSDDIGRCINTLGEQGADTAMTVCRDNAILWTIGADGYGVQLTNLQRSSRQNMPSQYRLTGGCLAMRRDEFLRREAIPCGKTILVCVDRWQAHIDTPKDLEIARAMAALR